MRRDERGAALIAALMALATLAILAAGTATLGMGATRSSSYWKNRIAALYVAESGINEAIYRLDQRQVIPRSAYPVSEPSDPSFTSAAGLLDDASSYQVWVEDIDANQVRVTARGTRDGVNRVVRVIVSLASSTSCLFYDSDGNGIIELSETPPPPRICPEIDVVVDIPPAPPGTPPGPDLKNDKEEDKEDKHKKDKKNKKQEKDKREPRTLLPGSYDYADGLRLENDAQLTIEGPATLYITGDLEINKNARLIINGEARFYISGDLSVEQDSRITVQTGARAAFHAGDTISFEHNASLDGDGATTFYVQKEFKVDKSAHLGSDPTRLTVFMSTETDPEVTLEQGAVFKGAIYAPTGEVELDKGVELTGAVVGYTVNVSTKAIVKYDSRLASDGEGGLGVVRGSWGEM